MTRPSKKARERSYLDWLVQRCEELRGREFRDAERPDFVADGIGVEITEFRRGSSPSRGSVPAQRESEREQVLRLARDEYFGRGGEGRPVHVALAYGLIPESVWPGLARDLAEFVRGCRREARIYEQESLPATLRPYVRWIQLGEIGRSGTWECKQAFSIHADRLELEQRIAAKETGLAVARQRAGSVWLFIVARGELDVAGEPVLATSAMLPQLAELADEPWESAFDRIYLGDLWTGTLARLEVLPRRDAR